MSPASQYLFLAGLAVLGAASVVAAIGLLLATAVRCWSLALDGSEQLIARATGALLGAVATGFLLVFCAVVVSLLL